MFILWLTFLSLLFLECIISSAQKNGRLHPSSTIFSLLVLWLLRLESCVSVSVQLLLRLPNGQNVAPIGVVTHSHLRKWSINKSVFEKNLSRIKKLSKLFQFFIEKISNIIYYCVFLEYTLIKSLIKCNSITIWHMHKDYKNVTKFCAHRFFLKIVCSPRQCGAWMPIIVNYAINGEQPYI